MFQWPKYLPAKSYSSSSKYQPPYQQTECTINTKLVCVCVCVCVSVCASTFISLKQHIQVYLMEHCLETYVLPGGR